MAVSHSFRLKNDQILLANILKRGSTKLEYIGTEIVSCIGIVDNNSHVVVNAIKSYSTEVENLFKTMEKHKLIDELEKQYYYIYIIEACNEILIKNSHLLLDSISSDTDNFEVDPRDFWNSPIIKRVFLDEKRNNLVYLCYNYEICRSFFPLSNNLAVFINGILALPRSRFVEIIKILKEILEVKLGFQRNIMNEKIAFQFNNMLKDSIKEPNDLKEYLKVLRDLMMNKNKLFKSPNERMKTKTKVTRLLIDITDNAFESVGEELISIEFDNIVKSLKAWGKGERNDIKTSLENSFNYFFDILNFYWEPDTKREVKLLIEVYMTGTTSEDSLSYDTLMHEGSKFLKSDNLLLSGNLMT